MDRPTGLERRGDIAYLIDDKGNTIAQKENGKASKKVSPKTAK